MTSCDEMEDLTIDAVVARQLSLFEPKDC